MEVKEVKCELQTEIIRLEKVIFEVSLEDWQEKKSWKSFRSLIDRLEARRYAVQWCLDLLDGTVKGVTK